MVKQWQDLFPENTRSEVDVQSPDFDILAQAYGIPAYKISDTSSMNEVLPTILQEK
jgi:thiamine pyrophosphate-dependent acetolactate synthase large subunit-like protein